MSAMGLVKAIWRTRKAGLLRLRPAVGTLSFQCLGASCSLCCKVTGGGVVATQTGCGRAALMPSSGGVCSMLSAGRCTIHASRPQGCREYPWYNVDGSLYFDSGCPGVRSKGDQRPDVLTIAPFESYFALPAWLQGLLKRVVRVW